MKRKELFLGSGRRLAIVLVIYTILGASLVGYYRYQINPDGISYISIAQKYLAGDFAGAVNGYWGPIYSWLLMPFLYFGVEALLATKVLSLAMGLATIVGLWVLSQRFEMPGSVRTVVLVASVPVILSFGFFYITPDLLLTCIVLFYLSVVFGSGYTERMDRGILCGVLGGAMYLSKSFGFPFFISHFILMNGLIFLRSERGQARRDVVHNFLAGFVAFGVISGIWMGLLSNKYGKLTIGTSAETTYRAAATPDSPGVSVLWTGFLEPSNETAISAWEDPSYVEAPPPEVMDSWSYFKHQLRVVGRHIGQMAGIFMEFCPLMIAIGVAYILFWLRRFNIKALESEVVYPTVTILLIGGAYSLVNIEARYLWVIFMLLMVMGGYVVGRLFESGFFTRARRAVLLVMLLLSFAVPAFGDLKGKAGMGKGIYGLSQALGTIIERGSRIASNSNWPGTLYLAYHIDCKYYGAQSKDIGARELKRQLEEYKIDYYFAWGGVSGEHRFLSGYPEITGGRIAGLKIYSLKRRR